MGTVESLTMMEWELPQEKTKGKPKLQHKKTLVKAQEAE